jgi:hypothetical protein
MIVSLMLYKQTIIARLLCVRENYSPLSSSKSLLVSHSHFFLTAPSFSFEKASYLAVVQSEVALRYKKGENSCSVYRRLGRKKASMPVTCYTVLAAVSTARKRRKSSCLASFSFFIPPTA